MDLARATAEVHEYVERCLDGYSPPRFSGRKVIRDAVYGFQRFEPHELSIIDSPLVQRLRGIHQTALSYMVYPSANHTRLEHSLGVATKAEQMATALADSPSHTRPIPTRLIELRLAGLFHDLGHGLFSHLTEVILTQKFPDLVRQVKTSEGFAEKTNLGEALSAIVVRSPAFRRLLDATKDLYPDVDGLADVSADRVASFILGTALEPDDQYLADIISGPFDADKLDYLGRDCRFTGIRAEIDWERITHSLDIHVQDGRRYLSVWQPAVPHLEQILFSKMMMFSAVYHHHKVRTLEAMVSAIFETAETSDVGEPRFRLQRITDIWDLDESAFFTLGASHPVLGTQVKALRNRDLLKRSLVLGMRTINREGAGHERYVSFHALSTDPTAPALIRRISNLIYDELPTGIRAEIARHQVRFDFPRSPSLSGDAAQCKVLVAPGEVKPLSAFFPTENWMATYADNKHNAHVFAAGSLDVRTAVSTAAESVFRELYGITFNPQARSALK